MTVFITLGGLFLIGYWSYTVILTYLGLISAFVGIAFSVLFASGDIILSVIFPIGCLLICGFCDMFDGRVARSKKNRSEDEKNFGIQIDSLCDLVCFTVLPATLGFCMGGSHVFAAVSGSLLILAGVVRLAYFNVEEMKRRSNPDNDDHSYTGLPVTSTALLVPIIFLFRGFTGSMFPTFYHICLIIIAVLFVLNFKLPKPGPRAILIMTVIGCTTISLLARTWFILIPVAPFLIIGVYMYIKNKKQKDVK